MSWSVSAVGKPRAVAALLATRLAAVKCSEPEETIKSKVGDIISISLAAFPAGRAVTVEASGSQTIVQAAGASGTTEAVNSVNLKISEVFGFIEDAPAPPAEAPAK